MNRSLNRLTLAILAGCCALPVTAQETAAAGAEATDNTEVIQVRGIRGSLTQALNTKRFSNSVLDSVSAEDIGDFPDKNIGDALQRIPGVTVSRSYGEVDGVNIRGTSPQQSMVLLNGQNVASVGWFDLGGFKRSFNFELMSAEQISQMDVYKSAKADINEGAMGGTINLKTRKPLDLDAFTVAASVESSKNSNADDWESGVSGLFSWKDEDEKLGVLVAHSIQNQSINRQTTSSFLPPSDGWAKIGDPSLDVAVPIGFGSILFDEERKRESSQVSLQYQASENLIFSLDYNNFVLENPHVNTALFGYFHLNSKLVPESIVEQNGVAVAGTVVPVTDEGYHVPLFINPVIRDPKMESDVINFTANYRRDNWGLDLVAGKSDAKSRGLQSSTWFGNFNDKSKTEYDYDITGTHIFKPKYMDSIMDHSQQSLYQEFSYLNNFRDHNIEYYQADYKLELDSDFISSVKIGGKYQEQMFIGGQERYTYIKNDTYPEGSIHNGILDKAMADGLTMDDFNGGIASGLHGENARPGTATQFPLINTSILDYAEKNKTDTYYDSKFSTEEEITSLYVMADVRFGNWRGDVGLRYVQTDVLSKTYDSFSPDQVDERGTKKYNNLLPSLNLVNELADDLLLRLAAGSTVSRPDYDQIQMSTPILEHRKEAKVGTPDLEPYTSDQVDLGIEWYFNESSLLSATTFYKDIKDYIEQTTELESIDGCNECLITRFRNAGDASVLGLELQYLQDFGNGFGLTANYTWTDSELEKFNGEKISMYGVSDNSLNVSGYYEGETFTARIAYNYRDEYTFNYNSADATAKPFDQVDASLIWHVTEQIDISLEAVNIFNETRIGTLPDFGNIYHSVDEFGARYFIGASYKM